MGNFKLWKKVLNLKEGFSNLEPEGQGRRIIMGVTLLLLLGLFYTIKMQIYVLFCTRLYMVKIDVFSEGNLWLSESKEGWQPRGRRFKLSWGQSCLLLLLLLLLL